MVAVQPPPQRVPIVDPKTGMPTLAMRDFIERLWQRAGGAGEIVLAEGPSVSTDNAVARYNGTKGNIQNSGVLLDDSDNLTGITSISELSTDLAVAEGGTAASTASAARSNLGLVIGTDVLSDVVQDTTPQAGGATDFQGFTITDHAIKVETISDANWNGASSFDYANGPVKKATRTNACTPDITNWPATGGEGKTTFVLAQGAGAVTWTMVDKWTGGSPPTLGSTAGDVDVIVCTTTNGGTTVLGSHVGTYS